MFWKNNVPLDISLCPYDFYTEFLQYKLYVQNELYCLGSSIINSILL